MPLKIKTFFVWLLLVCLFPFNGYAETVVKKAEELPIIYISAKSLSHWKGKSDKRDAKLTYYDPVTKYKFTRDITIKPQGTSSLGYEKKNFTIVLDEGIEMKPGWGVQNEYCLKANYIDPTHAGNVVSARLVAQMNASTGMYEDLPGGGAIDGFPVWVKFNGENVGMYTWNIPKAAWMFGMDEDNENHIVMCCEGWTDGCLLQDDGFMLDSEWSLEVGSLNSNTIVKFDRLLDFISTASDEEFVQSFSDYLNLDACLNYYCYMCISLAWDNAAKNMLMVTWDGKVWQPMLYDLDSLWGIDWSGTKYATDGAVNIVNTNNRLFQRLRVHFKDEIEERYAMLRSGVLSDENIWNTFDAFALEIPKDLMQWENRKWNPKGKFIRSYETMQEAMAVYLPQIDAAFGFEAQ